MSEQKSKRGGARPGAGRPSKAKQQSDLAAYEASYRYNPQRMWVYSPTLDAQKELTSGSRHELLKKAQWLYNNSGLAGGAVDKIARLVGPLQPQARTMDEKWNRQAEQAFGDACRNAAFGVDVSGFVNFDQAVPLLVRQMAIAGDVFWQRITSSSGRGLFRLIPGTDGVLPYRRRSTVTTRSLQMIISGTHDQSGNTTTTPLLGLQANFDYLVANVVAPTGSGNGTRAAILTMPDASTRLADVHVLGIQLGDTGPGGQWAKAVVELSIPAGKFA